MEHADFNIERLKSYLALLALLAWAVYMLSQHAV
jgi:hypothetical protein